MDEIYVGIYWIRITKLCPDFSWKNYIVNLNFCIPLMVLSIYFHSEYM